MEHKLSYTHPATEWTEALPLGNGRMGAMHFGGVEVERFQLNEDTVWSGPPATVKNKGDRSTLKKVRDLIANERYEAAEKETKNIIGPDTQAYMPFGNLVIQYFHSHITRSYARELNIDKAISTVDYTVGKVDYKREAFMSHPHQVLAIKLMSSAERQLNVMISMDSLLKHTVMNTGDDLILQGICPEYCAHVSYHDDVQPVQYGEPGETKAVHFEGRIKVDLHDGALLSENGKLVIQDATSAVVYLTMATSFNGYDQFPGKDFDALSNQNKNTLSQAMNVSYKEVKEAHMCDYQALFNRVALSLDTGENKEHPAAVKKNTTYRGDDIRDPYDNERSESYVTENTREHPDTDKRIEDFGADDLGMVTLLFQYGRYLMIASSREGTQPANLQGIWNESTRAPWSSNYTMNINAEMNYWPAETTNLAECHRPLLQAVQELADTGEKMVTERYGLNGWTAHHNSDLWRHAGPASGDPIWAFWPMSGAWLTTHLWHHFLYSRDKMYLKDEAFPVMKGAVQFYLDWLVKDENGYMLTSPSTSPEHKFITDDGQVGSVTEGAAMDLSIIRDLFTHYIEAADVLLIDDAFLAKVKDIASRLHPLKIGKYGQLQEWATDYTDSEPQHRHVSHLYGLYPGNQITEGPLLDAARQSLDIRGDEGTGWSLAWKLCLWARLHDGERIERLLEKLFNIVGKREGMTGGGLYPNLFGAHPPFQIDGNFGYTAGIVEAIVQSNKGYVELLPALPPAWIKGFLSGVRVRGGFELDVAWDGMQVSALEIVSRADNTFILKIAIPVTVHDKNGKKTELDPEEGLVSFDMRSGERYKLSIHY